MKRVIVIPDGGSDVPLDALSGRTPLDVAHTPVMDTIASRGGVGRVRLTPDGFTAGTDVCHLELFGYSPARYYSGRAALEAFSVGARPRPDDAVVRLNLVHLDPATDRLVHFGADYIDSASSRPLVEALRVALAHLGELHFVDRFHHALVLRGLGNRVEGTATAPPHQHMGERRVDLLPHGPLADVLAEVIEIGDRVLRDHPINRARLAAGSTPANAVWPWSQGRPVDLPSFADLHGSEAALLTSVPVLEGVAAMVGITRVDAPGMTASLDTDYASTGRRAVEILDAWDVVMVHVDAPDEASHLGDLDAKRASLEAIDRYIVAPLYDALTRRDEAWQFVIVPDHYTLVQTGAHDGRPVPFAVAGSCAVDGLVASTRWTEAACARAAIWCPRAFGVMAFGAPESPPG